MRMKLLLLLWMFSSRGSGSVPASIWDDCGTITSCGVEGKCVQVPGNRDSFQFPIDRTKISPTCSVGLKIQILSEVHWKLQLIVNDLKIVPRVGISLVHSPYGYIASCSMIGNKWKWYFGPNKDLVGKLRTEVSKMTPTAAHCVFDIRNATKLLKFKASGLSLEYAAIRSEKVYNQGNDNLITAIQSVRRCDMEKGRFWDNDTLEGIHKEHANRDEETFSFNCNGVSNTKLYAQLVSNGPYLPVKSVTCEAVNSGWQFRIEGFDGSFRSVIPNNKFGVFCGGPVTRYCKPVSAPGMTAPRFEKDVNGDAKVSCRGKKILINKAFYTDKPLVCKGGKNKKEMHEALWFVEHNGEEVKVTEGECTENVKCDIASNYIEMCPRGANCSQILKYDGLSCPVEHTLRVLRSSGAILETPQLDCDFTNGNWYNILNKSDVMDKKIHVSCIRNPEKKIHVSYATYGYLSYAFIGVTATSLVIYVITSIRQRL